MLRPSSPPGHVYPLSVPATRHTRRFSNWGDRLLLLALWLCAAVAGLVTLLIVAYGCAQSFPFLREIGVIRLFTDPSWAPTRGLFNLIPMLVGSLYVTLGAVSIASVLGIGLAIFDTFYAPAGAARVVRGTLSLLAGIPSVVYGLWGLTVLVPLLNRAYPPGFSVLLGILVLTIMILPTITLLADAALQAVPQEYVLGAAALGCTRWQMVRGVVLPTARPGLGTAVLLGITRALGETMAVSMVMGNTIAIPDNILAPARTLTAHIALEMGYALADHRAALFVAGGLVLCIVIAITIAADSLNQYRSVAR